MRMIDLLKRLFTHECIDCNANARHHCDYCGNWYCDEHYDSNSGMCKHETIDTVIDRMLW